MKSILLEALYLLLVFLVVTIIVLVTSRVGRADSNKNEMHIHNFGVTVHGVAIEKPIEPYIRHRITSNGAIVAHKEEFSLLYKRLSEPSINMQYNLSYFRDCFGNAAGFLGVGPFFREGILDVGFVVGALYRTRVPRELEGPKTIPMPLATLGVNIPIWDNLKFVINGGTNYALTHVMAGFSIGF